LFGWEVGPGLSFYLLLVISAREDRFTVEVAWSRNGHFPARATPSQPIDFPELNVRRDEPRDGDFRFRLARLWTPRGADPWWELAPRRSLADLQEQLQQLSEGRAPNEETVDEALNKVGPLVDDAVRRIVEHALPYFRGVGASHGIQRLPA